MNILKSCIEFVLMLLILWLAAIFVIFAGAVLIVFTPIIALWCLCEENDDTVCNFRIIYNDYVVEKKYAPMNNHLVVTSSYLYNKEKYYHDSRRIKAHQYTN